MILRSLDKVAELHLMVTPFRASTISQYHTEVRGNVTNKLLDCLTTTLPIE